MIAIAGVAGHSKTPMPIAGNHPHWQKGTYSLYVHVPFCRRKCPYCHFYVLPYRERDVALLDRALHAEWQQQRPLTEGLRCCSLYFGGGTPALVSPGLIHQWICLLLPDAEMRATCEITLEANPEDLSPTLLRDLRAAGINRLSLGVQSLQDAELRQLGRHHSAQQAIEMIQAASEAGLHNLSIDLMMEIPGQSEASWLSTLEQAAHLPITHLSLYNLQIEPHTAFDRRRREIEPLLPSEASACAMLEQALSVLPLQGFERYELSAFCRDQAWSRHNTGYWLGRPFLGLGPAAWSFWGKRRWRNLPRLHRYAALVQEGTSAISEEESLCPAALRREMLAIQLRLTSGVEMESFWKEWGEPEESLCEQLEALQRQGLLERRDGSLLLTPRGALLHDTVASELVL